MLAAVNIANSKMTFYYNLEPFLKKKVTYSQGNESKNLDMVFSVLSFLQDMYMHGPTIALTQCYKPFKNLVSSQNGRDFLYIDLNIKRKFNTYMKYHIDITSSSKINEFLSVLLEKILIVNFDWETENVLCPNKMCNINRTAHTLAEVIYTMCKEKKWRFKRWLKKVFKTFPEIESIYVSNKPNERMVVFKINKNDYKFHELPEHIKLYILCLTLSYCKNKFYLVAIKGSHTFKIPEFYKIIKKIRANNIIFY